LLPSFLRRLSTDEYVAPPHDEAAQRAAHTVRTGGAEDARRLGISARDYWSSRAGTAAGLIALNEASGGVYYEVPPEAKTDSGAASEAFRGDGPVIDVQTHYVASRPGLEEFNNGIMTGYTHQGPDWWSGLDGMVGLSLAEYMRCIFVESETAAAVLSSGPGGAAGSILDNDEMAGTRELIDRLAGTGRLLNHTVVRPNRGDIDYMEEWAKAFRPVGWKVYTVGHLADDYGGFEPGSGWMLDDDETGMPFLAKAQELGVNLVCAHKGVSNLVDTGHPRDVGPAALAFPDINFVIYHSGFEPLLFEEGPYTEEFADQGANRFITTLRQAGLGAGSNVYGELGTTWFNVIRRPQEAAHLMGKLLVQLGEDNIIWGTDGIWYGPTQAALDAFRAFQIPDEMCERYGYPKLTAQAKRKILTENAARLYGLDVDDLQRAVDSDDLAWTKAVVDDFERNGTPKVPAR
jgi:predicted TIM-barrel fold metal-dependent hydrolase